MEGLNIALSKGTLFGPSLRVLKKAGLDVSDVKEESRRMVFKTDQGINFLLCRPSDVTTYVEYGAADVGIAGKDAILESQREIYELADLGFGKCQFIVAVPQKSKEIINNIYRKLGEIRVATKYSKHAQFFFSERGVQAEIIKLRGAVELAPVVELSDVIFDLMTTGKTLAQNKLEVIDKGEVCTARLIANRVSLKLKSTEIERLSAKILSTLK